MNVVKGVDRSSLLNASCFLLKLETKSSVNGKLRKRILEVKKRNKELRKWGKYLDS